MREDLLVPSEEEERQKVCKTRVVTIPFTPLVERMTKEKPELVPGLEKLKELLGEAKFSKYVSPIHNINLSGQAMLIVADSELHRTNLERECIRAIREVFAVTKVRIVAQG